MRLRRWAPVVLAVLPWCAAAPDTEALIEAGNGLVAKRDYPAAKSAYEAALAAAGQAGDDKLALTSTRKLAAVSRLEGAFAQAEDLLNNAVRLAARAYGDRSEELATVLSELAGVQRAQQKRSDAMLTLDSCIQTRRIAGSAPADTVRDLVALARTLGELEDFERAGKRWQEALDLWDASLPQDSPEVLGILDALAALHRDRAEYEAAESLLRRALTAREAAYGPASTELISTLDSLAYVLFGQKKYADAEPCYTRLLAIWKSSAGDEHPMVALTLEKMAEFFAAQEKYAAAEPLLKEALAIRTMAHLRSLHQTGRVMLMQANVTGADELYRRAIRMGDDAGMPDEVMDPLLRVHAQILKELKRTGEAAVLEKRYRDAILRNQKLRPSPVKLPPAAK